MAGKEVRKGLFLLLGVLSVLLISSCEAIFTYSPVSFLQRDPANMSTAQKVSYAEEALSSGNKDAMLKAYESIKDLASKNPKDVELNMLAAKLAVELSGVPDVIDEIVQGKIDLGGNDAGKQIADFLGGNGVDPSLMIEASTYYVNADSNGGDLSSTDYIMGAIGILLDAADDVSSDYSSISDPSAWSSNSSAQTKAKEAADFLDKGLAGLPDNDPAKETLQQFSDFIGNYY